MSLVGAYINMSFENRFEDDSARLEAKNINRLPLSAARALGCDNTGLCGMIDKWKIS